MDLEQFYFSLITIFLIIILGFILGKVGWVKATTNSQLTNLLLMVFMPATLFSAFPVEYSDTYRELFLQGLAAGALVMLVVILIAKIIYPRKFFPGGLHEQSQFAFIFNNATFLGYPLISAAFGTDGVVPYCGFIIAFNFALFSYGVWLFEHKLSWKFIGRTLTNPNILAVLIGLVIWLCGWQLPTPVSSAVSYVAAATIPLSLICVGYMLSTTNAKELLQSWKLLIIVVLQLVLSPLITFGLLKLCGFPDMVVMVCSLIQALPTATSLGLFAEKYNHGHGVAMASQLVVMSTLLSVITLPIMALVIL